MVRIKESEEGTCCCCLSLPGPCLSLTENPDSLLSSSPTTSRFELSRALRILFIDSCEYFHILGRPEKGWLLHAWHNACSDSIQSTIGAEQWYALANSRLLLMALRIPRWREVKVGILSCSIVMGVPQSLSAIAGSDPALLGRQLKWMSAVDGDIDVVAAKKCLS